MKIFLTGYMGTGKTSVSLCLGKRLSIPVVDMDAEIERRSGMSINEIFKYKGEESFRDMETALLRELSDKDTSVIVSCGGGVVLRKENRDILKKQNTILLIADPAAVLKRLSTDNTRPLLKDKKSISEIRDMMDIRMPLYRSCARQIIDTDKISPEEVCSLIQVDL